MNLSVAREPVLWCVGMLAVVGLAAVVNANQSDSCSRSRNVVTCDTRADALESGAAEAKTKGLAGACVEPRGKYAGDRRYSVSLTATDCPGGAEFVAASS